MWPAGGLIDEVPLYYDLHSFYILGVTEWGVGGGGVGGLIPHSRRRLEKPGLNTVRNSGSPRIPSNFHTVLIRYIGSIFYVHRVLHPNGQMLSRTCLASVSLLHWTYGQKR